MTKNIPVPEQIRHFVAENTDPEFPWNCSWSDERHKPFADLTDSACKAQNGKALFPLGDVVPLATNSPISLKYLGESYSDDGCMFHAFWFSGPGYDVVSWVEDDLSFGRTIWRGDEKAYGVASLTLRLSDHPAEDLVA